MLQVKNLNVSYGAIHAVHDIDLTVQDGEIVSLIGANGAGKTTILQTISGLKKADTGEIILDGLNLRSIAAHKIVTLGVAQVPEGRRVFAELSVQENLELGAYVVKDKAQAAAALAGIYQRFPRLEERKKQLAGTLSGGEQQMLAMGRALMSDPKVLLLDEPSMGLSPLLVKEIFSIIKELNQDRGITILLVEQNAKMALSIASRAYVLETGNIIMEGTGRELLENEKVKKAYLGA